MNPKKIIACLMGTVIMAPPLYAMKKGNGRELSTRQSMQGKFVVNVKRKQQNKSEGPVQPLIEPLEYPLSQVASRQAPEDVGSLACVNKRWEKIINSPAVTHYLEREGCWNLATRGAKISRDINSAIVFMSKLEKNSERISTYLKNPFADLNYHVVSEDGTPETYNLQEHNTALTQACYSGCSALVDLYLNHGADANMRCSAGTTPLYWSVAGNLNKGGRPVDCISLPHRLISVQVLCSNGADVNQANASNGKAAILHTMAQLGKYYPKHAYPYIEFLIKKGAAVNGLNAYQMTPLHTFLALDPKDVPYQSKDHVEIMFLFLEKGADCSLPDVYGHTVFDYAREHGDYCGMLLRVHALTAKDDTDFPLDSL